MIGNKELLIFDEPTSGLDYESMEKVASLIQQLAYMGKIIFVVTHDYEFVSNTCSRVIHLKDGGIHEDIPVCLEEESRLKNIFSIF